MGCSWACLIFRYFSLPRYRSFRYLANRNRIFWFLYFSVRFQVISVRFSVFGAQPEREVRPWGARARGHGGAAAALQVQAATACGVPA